MNALVKPDRVAYFCMGVDTLMMIELSEGFAELEGQWVDLHARALEAHFI